jgi:hypothetical protein
MLSKFSGGHIISRNMFPLWTPNLFPFYFYLWGILKENVYKNNLHTQKELK